MSLTCVHGGLSNPLPKPGAIAVIVIVVTVWPTLGNLIGAYADALATMTLLGTAYVQHRRTATAVTTPAFSTWNDRR
ncbi:hypothetical protein M1P56_24695 [Streptomyces sp. HU2014]|uniref:hypothetical protein n=1 Tax=Streptomyces sp. HU2014 TaxID=2939414 RepID=UPI00200D996E|nr:hypothetical protein [Streptomyces sp. HU2014]UQI47318.1 hypothetical protein M1P56_24695 [Streptomyces sp. HU2014]